MYITRSEIERLFGTTTYFSEAYKDAESSLHNNIGDVYDLDTELRRTGSTRDVVIFTLFSHLISLNMALKGNKKIDSSKCFDIVVRIITELKIVQIVSGSNVTLDTSSFDKQLSGDDNTVQKALNTLNSIYTTQSITISVADWSGGLTTTKTVTGVTATSFNSICADKDNSDLLGDFGVIGDSQDTDEITFKADETPTEDISLTVVIFS